MIAAALPIRIQLKPNVLALRHNSQSVHFRDLRDGGPKDRLTTGPCPVRLYDSEVSMKSIWIGGVSAIFFTTLPVAAQPVIGAKSGIVNYLEGSVYLADKPLELQPTQFPEIKENVTLRSEEGRAEILLTPGTVMRIGENTSFKMVTNRLVDTRLDLMTGSATVVVMEVAKDVSLTIAFKDSQITFAKAGIYRLDAEPGVLKVFKGAADVKNGSGVTNVASGKMLTVGGAMATAEKFNPDLTDSLDRWTRRRDELMAMSNVSAANQARKSSTGANPCPGGMRNNPMIISNLGSWGYNPYYGLGTYIPCHTRVYSPYGYQYYSPMGAYNAFYAPRPVYRKPSDSGFGGMGAPSYSTAAPSSGGYSGVSPSYGGSSGGSAPVSAPSSGSSAASSARSSTVGGGAAGTGGGRGH